MISRTRILITAAFVCHLIVSLPLVTRKLLWAAPPQASPAAGESAPAFSIVPSGGEEVKISAITQEMAGREFKLHGQAHIHYLTYDLRADEMSYNADSGEASAEGHVVLEGAAGDEHLEASRAVINIRSQTGRLYNVAGSVGIQVQRARTLITSSNPFLFTGKLVEKTGPEHYVVHDGSVTTCQLPRPKWQFNARKVVVDVGANARIHNATFSIKGVPVLYLPYATHPIERKRESGLMLPNFGNSSRKGYIVGESLYWALNRSMDLTLGADYYSLRGWAPHGEFRVRPSEDSYLDLNYSGMVDRGIGFPPVDQGGHNVRLSAESLFPHNLRAVARIDYLSSFVYRLAFNEIFSQAVQSEVKSVAFLSNTTRGISYNALVERYQNFESTTPGDVITILHAPSISVSAPDHRLGRSPLYWAFDAAAEGLSRSEPGFRTGNLLGRFDLNPSLSLPLLWKGWALRPELTFRNTAYTQRLVAGTGVGIAVDDRINRRALEGTMDLRPPPLTRILERERLGRKWKHVVEPRVTYRYVTGVNDFQDVLRFDERDILSNTNEVEYGMVNRIYAKRTAPGPEDCATAAPELSIGGAGQSSGGPPWEHEPEVPACAPATQARQLLSWELKQTYFLDTNFGNALIGGARNVFTTTADFTGIAFLTEPRRLSPLVSRLRVRTSAHSDAEWDLDYDFKHSRMNASTILLNYYVGPFTIGGGDAYLRTFDVASASTGSALAAASSARSEFHQFRVIAGYGQASRRGLSVATSFGFDAQVGFLQYAAAQTNYNWDCCGVSLEYRRFALGSVRNENQYRFSFNLANIATVGNLRRQDRLF